MMMVVVMVMMMMVVMRQILRPFRGRLGSREHEADCHRE